MQDLNHTRARLTELLAERILVLDGAWGVLLQGRGLSEEEFRGEPFRDHPRDVQGDPDLLNLTQPQIVSEVHRAYLEAGADITTTNTFTATSIGQGDYGLQEAVYDMNVAGARLAKEATADYEDRFVAGSVGPLNVTLSLSPKVEDAAFRTVTFDQVYEAYAEQMRGLRDGGADLLLIETIFDTLNAKAAIAAAKDVAPELPIWLSVTIVDRSGRTLSGQTIEAFWISVAHAEPVIVGVNCSLGASEMRPYVEDLARVAPIPTACYPNAGLPNAFGGYDETPEITCELLTAFAVDGLVNLVGGCCGTGPEHIAAIAESVRALPPRAIPEPADDSFPTFSGLEPFRIRPDTGFVTIGERQNVTGSAKFRRLIESGDYEAAVEVALDQVQSGANLLDVNMDADLLDSEQAMTTFLNLIATEPEIARVPIMVDSSRWSVLEAGLKCIQGKGVVNSISLKEGEADFLEKARRIKRYGAAVVVMAFDETGQAGTVERKFEICERAYRLLVEEAGYEPADIIFDPNILAIATGMEEHAEFAKAFIEATREIKRRCPGSHVSGGVSNLSFSFRGNEPVRQRDPLRVPVPRDRGRPRHGDRERRPADGVRRHPAGPARARRGHHLQPPARRDRAHGRVRRDREGRRPGARARPLVARGVRAGAPVARARARHRRVHRGRHRGGATGVPAPARGDRGAADGRHEDRRRPLRLRQDVPAAGREERARDEEGRRLPRAVHGGGEGGGRRRDRSVRARARS